MSPSQPRVRSWRTLTEWELLAISGPYNLADGHARGWITSVHHDIAERLTSIYESSIYRDQGEAEREFTEIFFKLAAQPAALESGPAIFGYSSSVCLDLIGELLVSLDKRRVGMVTPTFDNIVALLQRRGLELFPLEEEEVFTQARELNGANVDALFLVCPNNPTGRELSRDQLDSIAAQCEYARIPLILDVSFRFFSSMNEWDLYATLRSRPSLDWITIEDTGKVWGISELKVGFSLSSPSLYNALAALHNELRLNVSPFILHFLQALMQPNALSDYGHIGQLFAAISQNRYLLTKMIDRTPGIAKAGFSSRSSVEWLRLPTAGHSASSICEALLESGVVVLPGGPFFWDDPARGERFLRIALLRDVRYFAKAVRILAEGLTILQHDTAVGPEH